MDEIFDRLKSVKIKKKQLIFPLIFSEILGILVLIWFLRVPLTQKYLSYPPKNYSVNSMNPDIQYLILQGDFISGKTVPNSALQIWLAQSGPKAKVLTDSTGNFSFQIPQDTKPASYQLIIARDNLDKTLKIKAFEIKVQSNNIFYKLSKSLPFL